MNMYDIIMKKKRGGELSSEEIRFFALGYTNGEIPDYQVSALLMAICMNGMTSAETSALTAEIAESGDRIDLTEFGHLSVDKHSTGGVGDKTTLIVAPIVAAAGGMVAKMSGRGLGHTGGTLDKLEAIPGYSISLSKEQFYSQVRDIGIAVIGQTGNLAPLDKKLYALRDVTATVDCIPLIASSVMGKKLAAGSHSIVLDVKCGSGSFMKDPKSAKSLAECMADIGAKQGRNVSAIITSMNVPLGHSVGNTLEVIEAIEALLGRGDSDLVDVCLTLSTEMIRLSLGITEAEAAKRCRQVLENGAALEKFRQWISSQGGDTRYIDNPSLLPLSEHTAEVLAASDGYIADMDTEKIGLCAMALGAGRASKEASIDYGAGLILFKKTGSKVKAGEAVARLYSSDIHKLGEGQHIFAEAVKYSKEHVEIPPSIIDVIKKSID